MGKRTVIAYLLSVAVMVGYYFYFAPKPQSPTTPPAGSASKGPAPAESAPATQAATAPAPTTHEAEASAPQELPPPKLTTVETSLYRAETLNLNGVLESLQLKDYHEGPEKSSPLIDLFAGPSQQNLKLQFRDPNFNLPPVIPFEVKEAGATAVEYTWEGPELKITKRIEWQPDNYTARVKISLENRSDKILAASPGLSLETTQHPEKKQGFGFFKSPSPTKSPILFGDKGAVHHTDMKKLPPLSEETGNIQWAGVEDRYF